MRLGSDTVAAGAMGGSGADGADGRCDQGGVTTQKASTLGVGQRPGRASILAKAAGGHQGWCLGLDAVALWRRGRGEWRSASDGQLDFSDC